MNGTTNRNRSNPGYSRCALPLNDLPYPVIGISVLSQDCYEQRKFHSTRLVSCEVAALGGHRATTRATQYDEAQASRTGRLRTVSDQWNCHRRDPACRTARRPIPSPRVCVRFRRLLLLPRRHPSARDRSCQRPGCPLLCGCRTRLIPAPRLLIFVESFTCQRLFRAPCPSRTIQSCFGRVVLHLRE